MSSSSICGATLDHPPMGYAGFQKGGLVSNPYGNPITGLRFTAQSSLPTKPTEFIRTALGCLDKPIPEGITGFAFVMARIANTRPRVKQTYFLAYCATVPDHPSGKGTCCAPIAPTAPHTLHMRDYSR